jgi:[FeFe] hydrogenase H-cluster maturation GTPase HydF
LSSLNETPRANRLHIGIFGKRNSGKSSLINALTGQNIALVSTHAGTTTDPVYKSMELHPIGPVVFIDTAGFDDQGDLGQLRVEKTAEVIKKTDVAILVFDAEMVSYALEIDSSTGSTGNAKFALTTSLEYELDWNEKLKDANIPVIYVINKVDVLAGEEEIIEQISSLIEKEFGAQPIRVSATKKEGLTAIRTMLSSAVPESVRRERIINDLVRPGDVVMLVMPQDIQAPKGRLILPQVQTIRELLDGKCTVVCVTADGMEQALRILPSLAESSLNEQTRQIPAVIITDSQCFDYVYNKKPAGTMLTSFSVLLAASKGDLDELVAGASAIDRITPQSKILIAEACTHAPLTEDIGREKLPRMLRKRMDEKYGQGSGDALSIQIVAGADFPKDLKDYDLIIHCGACMFNRKYMMSRISQAQLQQVPITNYGVVLAHLTGILDKINLPKAD